MHGLGNHCVVVDGRDELLQPAHEEIYWVCNRHIGTSRDQRPLIEPAATTGAPARMRIDNIDGAEAQAGLNALPRIKWLLLRVRVCIRLILETLGGMIKAACASDHGVSPRPSHSRASVRST
ncbi:hypothetical protein C4E04_04240 [Microvirga sp. 17 mud 1-3]|nr:hypothetical protein C4E04_04240 [Microvirga sp. 17 mud 1-3]